MYNRPRDRYNNLRGGFLNSGFAGVHSDDEKAFRAVLFDRGRFGTSFMGRTRAREFYEHSGQFLGILGITECRPWPEHHILSDDYG